MSDRPSHALFWPLVRREISTRFASGPVGFMWAFIIPLAWVGVGMIAFSIIGRITPIETHPSIFLATGVLPYAIFRQTTASLSRALLANRLLIGSHGVKRHVMATAYMAIDAVVTLGVSLIIFSIMHFVLGHPPNFNVLMVVIYMICAWGLGSSLGFFLTAFIFQSDTIARLIPIVLRPFFWISGVFFVARDLLPWIRDALAFNPLFLIVEGLRTAYFETYQTPLQTLLPTLIWIACLLILGALLMRPGARNTVVEFRQ